ncbi:MAG: TolC family outer membrane protein [Gammaproteobacteria bacterium]
MSLKHTLLATFTLLSLTALSNTLAADLSETYREALANDPTFKAAGATLMATKEKLPISRAALLPNLSASTDVFRNFSSTDGTTPYGTDAGGRYFTSTNSLTVTLKQPVFNYTSWAKVQNASALVKQGEATYFYAQQDLILRTATAYLNVLQAIDVLRYTRAEKTSIGSTYNQEQQRFKVGLIPITNLYEAKARYDKICADEITAQFDVTNKKEKLREIIGHEPDNLTPFVKKLPLITPDPSDIEAWTAASEKNNYSLQAAYYGMIAAKDNILVEMGGHMPTVDASSSYYYSYNNNASGSGNLYRNRVGTLGLTLQLPVYQGGLTSAKVREANDNYQQSVDNREKTYRTVVSTARQSYLGTIDAISKVKADEQAVISNDSNYKAMGVSYHYGTRTMTDLLNAESGLYSAQKNFAIDQYQYLIQTLTLKQAAGSLSEQDLKIINNWLDKSKTVPIVPTGPVKNTPSKISNDLNKKATSATKLTLVRSQGEKYVLSLNPQHYVLQLEASNNEQTLRSFIANHPGPLHLTYVGITTGDGKIYKLIAGDYASQQQAESAKTKLAQAWHLSPWARKVSSLQSEINH